VLITKKLTTFKDIYKKKSETLNNNIMRSSFKKEMFNDRNKETIWVSDINDLEELNIKGVTPIKVRNKMTHLKPKKKKRK